MDDVRNDVYNIMNNGSAADTTPSTPTQTNELIYTRLLKYGRRGDDVKQLQEALIKLGYSVGGYGADGDFGAATEKAVIKFQ
jgi:peptidoglycan hydrolase-like protein with peptidoglycan-binding domain